MWDLASSPGVSAQSTSTWTNIKHCAWDGRAAPFLCWIVCLVVLFLLGSIQFKISPGKSSESPSNHSLQSLSTSNFLLFPATVQSITTNLVETCWILSPSAAQIHFCLDPGISTKPSFLQQQLLEPWFKAGITDRPWVQREQEDSLWH